MTCSKEDTEEGREQEKVSTKKVNKRSAGIYFLPFAVAVPISAVMVFAFQHVWPYVHKMASILIKLVVKA